MRASRRLAGERHRYAYRRLGMLFEREGVSLGKRKLFRLDREKGLALRPRRGQAGDRDAGADGSAGLTEPALEPGLRADALSWGRRFRILCIADRFTREALAVVVDTSIGGHRMVRELDALIARRGKSAFIFRDNGTEPKSGAQQSDDVAGDAGKGQPDLRGLALH